MRCLRRSAPSFDYNKDVKGKSTKRWQKEPKRNRKKNWAGFHIGEGFIIGTSWIFGPFLQPIGLETGPQVQKVMVMKPSLILSYPDLIKISYLINIMHLKLKKGLVVKESKERHGDFMDNFSMPIFWKMIFCMPKWILLNW